jgi:hypothetical protein
LLAHPTINLLIAPKQLAWLLVKELKNLDEVEQAMLQQILQDPEVENAYDLVQRFQKMVREHRSAELDPWIREALTVPCLSWSTLRPGYNVSKK